MSKKNIKDLMERSRENKGEGLKKAVDTVSEAKPVNISIRKREVRNCRITGLVTDFEKDALTNLKDDAGGTESDILRLFVVEGLKRAGYIKSDYEIL